MSSFFIAFSAIIFVSSSSISASPPDTEIYAYYVPSDRHAWATLSRQATRLTAVLAMGYSLNAKGELVDGMDPRLRDPRARPPVRVIPVVFNHDVDRASFHAFLHSAEARALATRRLVDLAKQYRYPAWHFDFENIDVADREAFSSFCRESGVALRKAGIGLSIAVVPRAAKGPGDGNHARWMHQYWRDAYDYRALCESADFIVLMSYNQHARHTPPGPVAGLSWVEATLRFTLGAGVKPDKIVIGVPGYSHHWFPEANPTKGAFVTGKLLTFGEAEALLRGAKAKREWMKDAQSEMAIFTRDGTNEYVALENARSFAPKWRLARKIHARGIALFAIGREDPAVWSLLPPEKSQSPTR